jgi:hypothetical protein
MTSMMEKPQLSAFSDQPSAPAISRLAAADDWRPMA